MYMNKIQRHDFSGIIVIDILRDRASFKVGFDLKCLNIGTHVP